jgi:hypothetical protein
MKMKIKKEIFSIIYSDSCGDDDDDDYDEDYNNDEDFLNGDIENVVINDDKNYKSNNKKIKFLNEKKLAIKKLQINLRNEEAKLILLKRLYYSQKFPQNPTNITNNNNNNVNKQQVSNQQQQLLSNKNQVNNTLNRQQQQLQQPLMQQQQQRMSGHSQINHRSTDIMNRNKKVQFLQ